MIDYVFKIGEKVIISKDSPHYTGLVENPKDMEGVVYEYRHENIRGYYYGVRWYNNRTNVYRAEDLFSVDKIVSVDKNVTIENLENEIKELRQNIEVLNNTIKDLSRPIVKVPINETTKRKRLMVG